MKGQGPSQKLDDDSLLTSKMASPLALQSIFLTLSIPEHPLFTDNNPFPGDSRAQTGQEGFGVRRGPKVVDPIHS